MVYQNPDFVGAADLSDMRIALLLHIYQPPTQASFWTTKITKSSYLKIIQILKKIPRAKIILNIPASLTEQLGQLGLDNIISDFSHLANEGKIEFTGTAAYHPLLPKLPKWEIERQIAINSEINKKAFGKSFAPVGFFPPEMAYSPKVGQILGKNGFRYCVVEESAYPHAELTGHRPEVCQFLFKHPTHNIYFFFRERESALNIAFARVKTPKQFKTELKKLAEIKYLFLAMDGETFGYYHREMLPFLENFLTDSDFEFIFLKDLLGEKIPVREVSAQFSTWGAGKLEEGKRIYPRWDNPKNPVQQLQWKLTDLAVISAKNLKNGQAREILDKALHSDQYWWASANPCWHPVMVEKGARLLRNVVENNPKSSKIEKRQAENLYNQIIATGKKLFGPKIIRC